MSGTFGFNAGASSAMRDDGPLNNLGLLRQKLRYILGDKIGS
jgi:hypothetical protein